MKAIQNGLQKLFDFKDEVIQIGITSVSAHAGCIYSMGASATGASQASLGGALVFGLGSVLVVDAVLQKVKLFDCARCVAASTDPLRRYGKMLFMAAGISVGMHFVNHPSHAEHHTIQKTPDGRSFILNSQTLCLPDGQNITKADTLWLSP